MKNPRYLFITFFFSIITACSNYLDVVPDMIATIHVLFVYPHEWLL